MSISIEILHNRRMSKLKEQTEKRKNRSMSKNYGYTILDKSYKLVDGANRINVNNRLNHEQAKNKLVYLCKKQGYKVYSEAIFTNKRRSDIYLPDLCKVIEVRDTESIKKFNEKIKHYPEGLDIIEFTVKEILDDNFNLLI